MKIQEGMGNGSKLYLDYPNFFHRTNLELAQSGTVGDRIGERVSPIKYNGPRSAISPELMEAVNNTNIANSSILVYNINVDASGMSDPKDQWFRNAP